MRPHSSAYVAKDGANGCAHCCHNRLNSFVSSSPPTVRRIDGQEPLFQNGRGVPVGATRRAIHSAEVLAASRQFDAQLWRAPQSARTPLRHTKGMHLLQSGVPLVMVKDFLGHVDMKSTEIYVQADLEMKRKALESATGPQPTQPAEASALGPDRVARSLCERVM